MIWLIILIFATLGNYWLMNDIGTIDDDDERDDYVNIKTNALMFNILMWIIFIVGAGTLTWGCLLGSRQGNTYLMTTLVVLGTVLLFIWTLAVIIELIVMGITYQRS